MTSDHFSEYESFNSIKMSVLINNLSVVLLIRIRRAQKHLVIHLFIILAGGSAFYSWI